MRIFLDGEEIEVNASNILDLLKELKINSETVVISKNDEIVTELEELRESDKIRLIKVISGG